MTPDTAYALESLVYLIFGVFLGFVAGYAVRDVLHRRRNRP